MININVDKKAGIPVRIGKLDFVVDTTDAKMKELSTIHKEMAKEFKEVGNDEAAAKKMLKKAYKLFLGKGSFKLVYEQTQSLVGCANILKELLELLPKAMDSQMTQQDKMNKLIEAKKK